MNRRDRWVYKIRGDESPLELRALAIEQDSDLRDLCSAVMRIGWDRELPDVRELVREIAARHNLSVDAPLAVEER